MVKGNWKQILIYISVVVGLILLALLIWLISMNVQVIQAKNKDNQTLKTNLQKSEKDKTQIQKEKQKLEKETIPNLEKDRNDWKSKAESRAREKERFAGANENQLSQVRVASAHYETPQGNENVVWDFLIGQGFSRNQTAGIMGNLQQEHSFRTDGDGLAQWMGGRKARLMAMSSPYSLQTQLQFLMIELNEGCGGSIRATNDVISATLIFQNQFERCGNCMQDYRIRYAHEILGRH